VGVVEGTRPKTVPYLSVVMPVFNEVQVVGEVVEGIVKHILDAVPNSELIVVNDHSTDESLRILLDAAAADERIRVVSNDENRGHGPSVRRGFDSARGAWIFHLDSHAQFDVREFPLVFERRFNADLVLGVRVNRLDPFHRLVLTRLTRTLVALLVGRDVKDANVPFKLVRRSLFDHVSPVIPVDVFAPSILLTAAACRSGARVVEVGVSHSARPAGRSKLRPVKLAGISVRCCVELVRSRFSEVRPYFFSADES
jgi:dolichol-phosphate mannosyltransferase